MKKVVLLFVVAISPLLIVTCVSKEVRTTEWYYETEYKTEETYQTEAVVEALSPVDLWYVIPYYHIYKISPEVKGQITAKDRVNNNIAFWNLSNVDIVQDMWTWYFSNNQSYSSNLPDEDLLFVSYLNYVQRTLKWTKTISIDADNLNRFAILSISQDPPDVSLVGTKTTIITHKVPAQIEKQRTVMQKKKIPFWEAIFNREEPPVKLPQVGDKAPDFTLESIDGKSISLRDFQGKIVLIVFTFVNCDCSETQMPYIIGAHQQANGELVVLNIYHVTYDTRIVRDYVTEKQFTTFPSLLDPENKVATSYSVTNLSPINFIIDKEGIIKYKKIGSFQSQEEIKDILKSL